MEDAAWDRVLSINLSGVFVTMQAAAAHMKPQRGGRIVAVASVAGLKSEVMCGYAYTATKAAVVNLVRQAAMEMAAYKVVVNGIAPGPFRTNIAGGRIKSPEVAAEFASIVPLGRIGSTDEIKGLALLLSSPASSFMTGTTIPVDGASWRNDGADHLTKYIDNAGAVSCRFCAPHGWPATTGPSSASDPSRTPSTPR